MPRTNDIDSLKSAQYLAEKTDIFDILLRRVLSFRYNYGIIFEFIWYLFGTNQEK